MNIDKEIDKLAKDLCAKYSPNCTGCPDCVAKGDAKTLIDKGWRKASDVAREIFKEIDTIIDIRYNKHIFGDSDLDDIEKDAVINFSDDISNDIEKLKTKYTEEKQ